MYVNYTSVKEKKDSSVQEPGYRTHAQGLPSLFSCEWAGLHFRSSLGLRWAQSSWGKPRDSSLGGVFYVTCMAFLGVSLQHGGNVMT